MGARVVGRDSMGRIASISTGPRLVELLPVVSEVALCGTLPTAGLLAACGLILTVPLAPLVDLFEGVLVLLLILFRAATADMPDLGAAPGPILSCSDGVFRFESESLASFDD